VCVTDPELISPSRGKLDQAFVINKFNKKTKQRVLPQTACDKQRKEIASLVCQGVGGGLGDWGDGMPKWVKGHLFYLGIRKKGKGQKSVHAFVSQV